MGLGTGFDSIAGESAQLTIALPARIAGIDRTRMNRVSVCLITQVVWDERSASVVG